MKQGELIGSFLLMQKKANPFNPTILWGFLIYKNKKNTFFDKKDAIFVTFYIGGRK